VEAAERWTRARLRLAAENLSRGLNRLTVCWPPPEAGGEAVIRAAVERLELGISADLHPVFGEIFSFDARALP
jgi:hypothetical protein